MESNTGEEMITITKKRYDKLIHKEKFLEALRGAGVDNWEGYCEAQNMMED
jgi:hypothetical protein